MMKNIILSTHLSRQSNVSRADCLIHFRFWDFWEEVDLYMLDLEGLEVVLGFGIVVSPGATLDLEHTRFLNPYLSGGRNESKNCNGFVSEMVVLRLL